MQATRLLIAAAGAVILLAACSAEPPEGNDARWEQQDPSIDDLEPMNKEVVGPIELPSADLDAIDRAEKAQARQAKSTLEVDTVMRPKRPYAARLMVERGAATTSAEIAKQTPEATVRTADVRVASQARATAHGTNLKVTRRSAEEWQTVGLNAPGVWTWEIEALEEGPALLMVELHHKVRVSDADRIIMVNSFPQAIEVSVGWWERNMARLGRALGLATDTADKMTKFFAALTGLGAAVAAFLALRKKPA